MNLWLISRTDEGGWDTYDSAVVVAESADAAAKTYPDPDASIVWGEGGWQYGDGRQVTTGAWVFPSKVAVKLLGTAAAGMKPGAVVGSFNAG